jgi:nucleosome-remodeling factor subunit BPTF
MILHYRVSICNQVLKGILDKIEREERKEQKLQKKAESAEEKQKRLAATKIQQTLYKHKEALKKEIQRKRTLNERNMQLDIQVKKMAGHFVYYYYVNMIVDSCDCWL